VYADPESDLIIRIFDHLLFENISGSGITRRGEMGRIAGVARTLFFVWMIVIFSEGIVCAQQAPINCNGPLSEEQLVGLLKGGVAGMRVQAIVNKCGIGFPFTPDVERRLRTAGASDAVIAEVRKQDEARRNREEEKLWAEARDGRSAERLQEYLKRFPDGDHVPEATEKLAQLKRLEQLRTNIRQAKKEGRWQEAESWLKEVSGLLPEDEEIRSWKSWIAEERSRALEARKREEEALWTSAKDGRSAERLEEYLRRFPDGDHASEARDLQTKMRSAEELRGEIRKAKKEGNWQEAEAWLKELAGLGGEDDEVGIWKVWVRGERARWDSMTLEEAKQEVRSLEEKIAQIRKTVETARDTELQQLERQYRSEREKAGQVAPKSEYERSVEYEARLEAAKQKQAALDAKWQADKDQVQRRYTTGLEEKTSALNDRIGRLKNRTYLMPGVSVQRIGYDADTSHLSVKINGEEYWFTIEPRTVRDLDSRLGNVKVEQYLGPDHAQERVLVDTATDARFNCVLRAADEERLRREELARIAWIDLATGLMWALNDNGMDVNWNEARRYCQQLRLGGFSDWRLPEIGELKGMYDALSEQSPKVRGGIGLSGYRCWSTTKSRSGHAWSLGIKDGARFSGRLSHYGGDRALCVRRPRE
jgi:hypothetical protein